MTNRKPAAGAPVGSPRLGLPEHSALIVEGRIERAVGVASHATGVRSGRERPLRSSSWSGGLWLVAGAFGLLITLLVVLYLVG